MSVVVKVLGRFEVVVDGATVPAEAWRRRQAALLVKLLALAEGHRLHREQVIDALWPGLAPESAAPRLHKAAHYARAAVGQQDAVVLSSEMVALLPGGDLSVDLERFEAAATHADRAQLLLDRRSDESEPQLREAARRLAAEAADLYTGDVLPDDPYEPWAEAPRDEARLLNARMLRQAERWEDLAASDPTHEEAHVRVAHMFARRGDRAAALRRLDLLERALAEMGEELSPTAVQLRDAVLSLPVDHRSPTPLALADTGTPIPALPMPIIGREQELLRTAELLDRSRILTVLGPGGVGKTTIAIEAARRRCEEHSMEACFVDLSDVRDASEVAALVAAELGLPVRGWDSDTLLREGLRGRKLVLVLDNFEHVLDAADLVARLTGWCPGLEVISTSRARLELTHEQVLDVQPFQVSAEQEQASRSDAVALFTRYARAVDPGFDPERHASDVVEICRAVEGLPLAIRLAASHVRTLSPPLLRTRLHARLSQPAVSTRDAPPRQQTIPATIDWSLQLLGLAERRLFARLGAFSGPARLESIEEVCGEPGEDVLLALATLVDQSLVQRVEDKEGEVRFRMLELLRQRARELLDEGPDRLASRQRHAEHFTRRLEWIEQERWNALAADWIGMVAADLADIRAAHAWVVQQRDFVRSARICAALGTFWHREGHHAEGRRWTSAVMPHLHSLEHDLAARVLAAAAFLSWSDDPLLARTYWEGAIARFRAVGNDRYRAYCQGLLAGTFIGDLKSYGQAIDMCQEAIGLARVTGEKPLIAQCLNVLGELSRVAGDDDLAMSAYVEGRDLAQAAGDRAHLSVFLANLAYLAEHRGDHEEALRLAREALQICWVLGRRMMAAWTVSEIAGPLLGLGRTESAARLVGAGSQALESMSLTRHLGDLNEHSRVVATLRDRLGEETYEALVASGAELTLDEAVRLALSESEDPNARPVT